MFIDQHSDPPDVHSATHNLMLSSSTSNEDFFKWLGSKGISDKDCKTLSGKAIPNQLVVSHAPLISARMYFHQHQHNTKVYHLHFLDCRIYGFDHHFPSNL